MLDLSNPVIAAVRSEEEYFAAIKSAVSAVFMLKAELSSFERLAAAKGGKQVYVHIDIAEGIGKDREGLAFLKRADGRRL